MTDTTRARRELLASLFPAGVPRLWCPPVSHFSAARRPDPDRTRRHYATLAPHVGGVLVPGSTGEGWAMTEADALAVLDAALGPAKTNGMKVLVGVLKHTPAEVHAAIDRVLDFVAGRGETPAGAGIVGFTVCPPRGADLGQPEIESALAGVLERGWPTAVYQLPQVTQNEVAPATAARLAARFPNFVLFKDTSGADRVALSGADLGGAVLVRGAEGDYARWPRAAGGPYDGFLLSTANAFAAEYAALFRLLDAGRADEAAAVAARVGRAVAGAFEAAAGAANAFAAANKLLDHALAHGEDAERQAPPLMFDGDRLDPAAVGRVVGLLRREGLLPKAGYLAAG
jgi:dihydrodipicolinate synthase/N-acetylneuraminate lyase